MELPYDNQKHDYATTGYCAGKMDRGLTKHRKMDCYSRKFKGLTQKQQHINGIAQGY
jgi:hypothetical protein